MNLKKAALSISFAVAMAALLTGCSENSSATKATVKSPEKKTDAVKEAANVKKNTEAVGTSSVPVSHAPINHAQYDSLTKKLAYGDSTGKWPVKNAPYPLPGAILPYKRIVAFYGNLSAKGMGILGELPPNEMLAKLKGEVKNWEKADPATPVQPALHYIAVVASGNAGRSGKYRNRMPFKQIDSVLSLANKAHAIVFLDVQVGLSTIRAELPELEKYLAMPQVHFGMDPEFSMKDGSHPGKKIGSYDADDINYVSGYLAGLVKKYNLPPKILIVHRFTKKMVTNYKNIKLHKEVQIVMDMDGWGDPGLKIDSYHFYIHNEPVQFTGFKLFYKNDIKKAPHHMLTPAEVLKYKPAPIYIQYQ